MTEPVPGVLIRDDETFVRMTRTERGQHLLLAASFAVLLATGLPALFGLGPGRAWRGLLHRGAALALIGALIWHALYTVLTERGRRNFRDKLPCRRDLRGAFAPFRRRGPGPEAGRFGFAEKLDYWGYIGGSAIMIVTGLLMWAPDTSLRLFPLAVHQAFVVVHGYEAILALLAVLIWHMYTVHLKPGVFPMSRVWLDGLITGADLKRFHPLEYRRISEDRERLWRELLARDAGPDRSGPPAGPGDAAP